MKSDELWGLIPLVITLVSGLLGVFFSKGGERAKVTWVGWLLVGLIVISGAYGAYNLHRQTEKRAEETKAARARERDLRARLANLGRVVLLQAFSIEKPSRYGIFYLDLGITPDGDPVLLPGFTGPFPTAGRAITRGEITLGIEGAFQHEFGIRGGSSGEVILSSVDGGGDQIFKSAVPHCYQTAAGQCVGEGESPVAGRWWVDFIVPEYTHGVMLASTSSVARLVAGVQGAETYGRMRLEIPRLTEAERREITAGLAKIAASFKFYVSLKDSQDREQCLSAILVPVALRVGQPARPEEFVVDFLPAEKRFDGIECEEPPF
jgi:hypothetical protein